MYPASYKRNGYENVYEGGFAMNQRICAVLQALKDGGATIQTLAEQFQVSQRTIRNDLKEVGRLLRQNGLPEIALQGGGKIVPPEDFGEFLPVLLPRDFYAYKLSRSERARAAAVMLAASSGYVTLAEIADAMFVSRATVIHDLPDIREFLAKNALQLVSRANKGLSVGGRESVKRRFLLRTVRGSQQPESMSRCVSVQAGDRAVLQKIIGEQEHVHQSFLTDAAFQDVLLYLGIMVNRNLLGEMLEPQPQEDGGKYLMAQDILRYVAQYCSVATTEDDIRFLCRLLDRARYLRKVSLEKDAIKIQMITRQFIDAVSDELEINLNNDYDFFENLANHLESVFSAPLATPPDNAVLEEVLEDNQEVLAAVRRRLPVIGRHVEREIAEVEVMYIAIHVCAAIERKKNKEIAFHVIVACHVGIGTSQLLMERLKKHFNFQVVDVISAHEAGNIEEGKADFIISTVPLRSCRLDYVIVSTAFSDSDYVRVGAKIDALRNSRHLPSRVEERAVSAKGVIERIRPIVYGEVPEMAPALMKKLRREIRDYFKQSAGADAEIFSPYLHHLLPEENIALDVECADWREAVRKSAEKLVERGYVEPRYIDAMIANIEANGPYVVLSPGFAVPHEGLEQGSIRVGMYLIRLKRPVPFGAEEMDPVEFVCCLSAVDHKTHLKAFFNLVNMLLNQEFKEMLHQCRTSEEAARIIEKYEYGTLG